MFHLIQLKQKRKRTSMAAYDQNESNAKPNAADSMSITLMINRENRKIIYAEAGKDFVDLLFSFLILPTGAIAKQALVSKGAVGKDQSTVRCITNLYKSVESISASVMKVDKSVLLDPEVVTTTYTNEILRIQSSPPPPVAPPRYYVCCNAGHGGTYTHSLSTQSGASKCSCGQVLNREVKFLDQAPVAAKDPVPTGYVKKSANFVITDDLSVIPVNSTARIIQLWNEFGVKKPTELFERNVTVGPNEVMGLLKAAMVSKTALNDVFKEPEC